MFQKVYSWTDVYSVYMCECVWAFSRGMESSSESNHLSLPPYSVSLAIFHLYDIDCNPSAPPLNIACGVWPQSQRQSDVENALTNESRPFCGNNTGGGRGISVQNTRSSLWSVGQVLWGVSHLRLWRRWDFRCCMCTLELSYICSMKLNEVGEDVNKVWLLGCCAPWKNIV